MFNNLQNTLIACGALDVKDDQNRVGDPPQYYDNEDTRARWTDLTDEQKVDEAVDYMREYTVRHGAQRASLLWQEALNQTKTTKGMINYIGKVMVLSKSETWCL